MALRTASTSNVPVNRWAPPVPTISEVSTSSTEKPYDSFTEAAVVCRPLSSQMPKSPSPSYSSRSAASSRRPVLTSRNDRDCSLADAGTADSAATSPVPPSPPLSLLSSLPVPQAAVLIPSTPVSTSTTHLLVTIRIRGSLIGADHVPATNAHPRRVRDAEAAPGDLRGRPRVRRGIVDRRVAPADHQARAGLRAGLGEYAVGRRQEAAGSVHTLACSAISRTAANASSSGTTSTSSTTSRTTSYVSGGGQGASPTGANGTGSTSRDQVPSSVSRLTSRPTTVLGGQLPRPQARYRAQSQRL